ncbi:hypothetical protein [Rhizobium sp.]|uniref:hypothetical protein n=1 Tax=Rhizobium sp. TaxID=391 RepID=UPI002AA82CC2
MADLEDQLRAEYIMLQTHYEAFDARALTIKSWAAPLLAGGLGLGLKEASIGIEFATIVASCSLWILEAIWKNFQYCYVARIKLLESYFRGEQDSPIPAFQTFSAWGHEWSRWFRGGVALKQRLMSPFVYLPYLPLNIAAIVAMFWILAIGPDHAPVK